MRDKREGLNMMDQEMTVLSQQMYDLATSGTLELEQAVASLRQTACVRTVRDILAAATHIPAQDQTALSARLTEAVLATDPEAKRDSVGRKVRIWLNDPSCSVSRQGAIALCFGLKLSLAEANTLVLRLSEQGLHWRDPEELCYIFALQNGMDYATVTRLIETLRAEGLLSGGEGTEGYTEEVSYELRDLSDENALRNYLIEHRQELGKLHNTAYSIFSELMELLTQPDDGSHVSEEKLSVRDVVRDNLYDDLIPRLKKGAKDEKSLRLLHDVLQRSVRENWPDETTLSKMKERKTDVTRKTLILLFLATDGGTSVYGDWRESEQSRKEQFEERYERLGAMLSDCGFAPLDPRIPFDWMILYCMCADDTLLIDTRIQTFLEQTFA